MAQEGIDPQDTIGRYKRLYLRGLAEGADLNTQVKELERRKKRVYIMLLFNVLALLFFGYNFYSGQTQLEGWVMYMIGGVVALNIFVMYRQLQQIETLSTHLKSEHSSNNDNE